MAPNERSEAPRKLAERDFSDFASLLGFRRRNLDGESENFVAVAGLGAHDAIIATVPLRGKSGISARALEFTTLTAARTGEAIGARWSQFDFEAKVWTVPAERVKAGKEHRAPLSDRVLRILSERPRVGDFVFPSAKPGKPISNMAMLELVGGMRGQGATVHGFHSTFRDWAADQTAYPNELCEMALARAVGDKTEAAYRRGELMEKRRRLMDDWAAHCEREPVEGGKVVPIREIA